MYEAMQGKSQKFVFNTQKLDHDGKKNVGLYTLGQYISASNRSTFLLNAPLWWKNGPWHIEFSTI